MYSSFYIEKLQTTELILFIERQKNRSKYLVLGSAVRLSSHTPLSRVVHHNLLMSCPGLFYDNG